MAYKFQIGAAKMSGSLEQEGNVDIEESGVLKIAGTTVIDASRNVSPALLKMPDVTSGKILVADSTSYQEVAVSGDVSIASNGAVTIAADAVTFAKMQNVAANSVLVRDANSEGVVSGLALATTEIMIGDGTGMTAAALSGDVSMSNAGAVTIANNAVSLAKMAGLTRGSIIIGDSSGDPSELVKGAASTFLQSDGTDSAYVALSGDATLSAGALTIANDAVGIAKMTLGASARGKIILGDSSGNPSVLSLGSAGQFLVSDNDDLSYRTMSGDATLAADGELSIGATKITDAMLNDDVASGLAGAGLSATGGVLSTQAATVTDWGAGAARTLVEGFNFLNGAALASDQTLQLPTAGTVGDVVHVKAPASLGAYDLEIITYAAQTIDGVQTIELESGGAAVSIVLLKSGSWGIY